MGESLQLETTHPPSTLRILANECQPYCSTSTCQALLTLVIASAISTYPETIEKSMKDQLELDGGGPAAAPMRCTGTAYCYHHSGNDTHRPTERQACGLKWT